MNILEFGEDFQYENVNKSVKDNIIKSYKEYDIMKAKEKYSKDQLKDLVDEHKNLVDVMSSESKEDDKKELKDQKEELEGYEKDLKKAFDILEKGMNHKYFKREGSAGNYKYYYTEADYKAKKDYEPTPKDLGYKDGENWLTTTDTVHLKQMMDILIKDYDKKTPKEKELLHSIQREWAGRSDNKDKKETKKDSLEDSISTNSEGTHQLVSPVSGRVVSESKKGESKEDFIKRIKSQTAETDSKKDFKVNDIVKIKSDIGLMSLHGLKKQKLEVVGKVKTGLISQPEFIKVKDEDGEFHELDPDHIEKSESNDIEKGAGEGTRGGKVIGHTSSGKPIYDSAGHASHKNFTPEDHADAREAHHEAANDLEEEDSKKNKDKAKNHRDQANIHHEGSKKKSGFGSYLAGGGRDWD